MALRQGLTSFDDKHFNPQAYGQYIDTIPRVRENKLLNSGVLKYDKKLEDLFLTQTGSHYAVIPMLGRINGTVQNYDGATDIKAGTTKTYVQGVIALRRAAAFSEKDFSHDITGGVDFLSNVANQISTFWEDAKQNELLAVLEGVFGANATDTKKTEFITKHTTDISAAAKGSELIKVDTLIDALQQATGDNASVFSLVFMHSRVAANLAKQKLIEYAKYTDAQGIERPSELAYWDGKLVIVSDYGTFDGNDKYITYVLGRGAISYAPISVKVPFERERNAAKNGGETTLYSRIGFVFAPFGLSYTKTSVKSPMIADLKVGNNWTLVNDGNENSTDTIDHKAIPIARIISKG